MIDLRPVHPRHTTLKTQNFSVNLGLKRRFIGLKKFLHPGLYTFRFVSYTHTGFVSEDGLCLIPVVKRLSREL